MVLVPEENVDAVAKALAKVGAGVIGDSTECTRRTGARVSSGRRKCGPLFWGKGEAGAGGGGGIETVVPAHTLGRAVDAAAAAIPTRRWR